MILGVQHRCQQQLIGEKQQACQQHHQQQQGCLQEQEHQQQAGRLQLQFILHLQQEVCNWSEFITPRTFVCVKEYNGS